MYVGVLEAHDAHTHTLAHFDGVGKEYACTHTHTHIHTYIHTHTH